MFLLMRIIALLISLYFTQNIALRAQSIDPIDPVDLEKSANEFFKSLKYRSAQEAYSVLDSIKPGNPVVTYRLGVSYLHNGFKKKALDCFIKVSQNHQNCPIEYLYYLGKAYHYNHNFDLAWEQFNEYKNYVVSHHLGNKEKLIDIDRRMEVCKSAKEIMGKPLDIKITNIGSLVNSPYAEYTPIVTADEQKMYFTARKPNTTGGLKDTYDEDYFEDIYVSEKTGIGWGTPKSVGEHINTMNHDAIVSITDDGQKLIVYKHVHNEMFDTYSGDLFYSDLEGNQWTDPQPFDNNINTIHWEPSAHLNSDENLLFFSSNKHGGFGGTDIYVSSKLPDGKWSVAENLGPKINTMYDDDAPFMMPDGKTLYFSSMGHKNIGGHDIFKSEKDSLGNWTTPQNLGYPINTPDDDLYFSWSADGKRIYFSSIREEIGASNSDIYMAELSKSAEHVVVLKGISYNSATKSPTSVKITTTNLTTGKLVSEHHSNEATGKYVIVLPEGKNYKITLEKNGYLFQSFNLEVPESKSYIELEKNIYIDSIISGKETFLRNVFFDAGDFKLKETSTAELDKVFELLEAYPNMFVEIVGNIDDMLDPAHNKFLSENRAAAIQEYLLKKGIDEKRVIAVGYTDDGANNSNIEERIEHFKPAFHIVSNMNFNYNRDKLKTHSTGKVKHHKHGEPMVGGFLHESIYFPENESMSLHKFSSHQLQHIMSLLNKYPSLKIRVEAHYDEDGDLKHNQHLAMAREKMVYDELIKLGVDSQRLALTAYPDKPTGTVNAGHENSLKNRRIKFRVLSF